MVGFDDELKGAGIIAYSGDHPNVGAGRRAALARGQAASPRYNQQLQLAIYRALRYIDKS